jgi:hypothetical protein
MIVKCKICRKPFKRIRKSHIFCSYECAVRGRKGKSKKQMIKMFCLNCGKEYFKNKTQSKTSKYCCHKCYALAQKKTQSGKGNHNYKNGFTLIKDGSSGKGRNYKKGRRYERKTRQILEKQGYYVTRSAASKGAFDLIAIKEDSIKLLQIKAGSSPFSKSEREFFLSIPVPKICSKELWSWHPMKKPVIKIFNGRCPNNNQDSDPETRKGSAT